MKARIFAALVIALSAISSLVPAWAASPNNSGALDIKQVVPADVYLAVYAHRNPNRDAQRAYFADAWKTVQDEQIGPRLLNIITSRVPQDKLATAKEKFDELQTALAPVNFHADEC